MGILSSAFENAMARTMQQEMGNFVPSIPESPPVDPVSMFPPGMLPYGNFQSYQPPSGTGYQSPFSGSGGLQDAFSASPYFSGNSFGFDQQGAVGGGMLGNLGKGLTPRPMGGMLSRGYFG